MEVKEPIITQKTYTGYNLNQKPQAEDKMPEWLDKFTETTITKSKFNTENINKVWP